MSKNIDYNIQRNQIRRDDVDEKLISNFEALIKSLDRIQEIIKDIDRRLEELE